MTDPQFSAADFSPTKYDSAEDKAKIVNDTIRFLRANTPLARFTKQLYSAYSLHFGHIAHYNREGFHDEWFSSAARRLRFVLQIVESPSWGFGPDWIDVRNALLNWLRSSDLIQLYALDTKREKNAHLVAAATRALDAMPEDVRKDVLGRYGINAGQQPEPEESAPAVAAIQGSLFGNLAA